MEGAPASRQNKDKLMTEEVIPLGCTQERLRAWAYPTRRFDQMTAIVADLMPRWQGRRWWITLIQTHTFITPRAASTSGPESTQTLFTRRRHTIPYWKAKSGENVVVTGDLITTLDVPSDKTS